MRPLALLLTGVLLAGCSGGGLTEAQKTDRCASFAAAVLKAGLPATPDAATAKKVGDSLDPLLSRLGTPAIHDPATRVHQRLHDLQAAQERGDSTGAAAAAAKATSAAKEVAAACGLPDSAVLVTS